MKLWDSIKWLGTEIKFKNIGNGYVVAYEEKYGLQSHECKTCKEAWDELAELVSDFKTKAY